MVVRYTSDDDDNLRWAAFEPRAGDIVVSSRSKHGTTWVQAICALLVHGTEPPAPLSQLSPWLDHLVEPLETVLARLEAQSHRRIVKTHTPLDGLPLDRRVTYVVPVRSPIDAAVSLHHQAENIDRHRLAELTGGPERRRPAVPVVDWLEAWIDREATPVESLESLDGVVHHVRDAGRRRDDGQAAVHLVHYHDLEADLAGEMRRLAATLGIAVDRAEWPRLVDAASFEAMRTHHDRWVPDRLGVLRDHAAFFRRGRSGAGGELLPDSTLARYRRRLQTLAGDEVAAWLDRPDVAPG